MAGIEKRIGAKITEIRLTRKLTQAQLAEKVTTEFIRKATHPHPCPLPSRERGLKNRPSLEGRGLKGRVFKCGFT